MVFFSATLDTVDFVAAKGRKCLFLGHILKDFILVLSYLFLHKHIIPLIIIHKSHSYYILMQTIYYTLIYLS